MMTSRSEYRLLLRQDNADLRLTPLGHEIGLISDERYEKFLKKRDAIEKEISRLRKLIFPPSDSINRIIESAGSTVISTGVHADELLKRPQITYDMLEEVDPDRPKLPREVREQVEISIKYEGYINRQTAQAEQFSKLENRRIPDGIDYKQIKGLRLEAIQKLDKIRPLSLGQASRISGVSPADIAVLMIYLK